jgi:LysW-gamma-L-lysine carboxypeptidase
MDFLDFFTHICQISSLSGSEAELASFLAQFLKERGFQQIPSIRGNVIYRKGSGAPVLLLASHLDTVSTNNPFHVEGKKFYGTGTVDCKASLATLFYAAATFEWIPDEGTVILAGLVQEETSLVGLEDLFQMNLKPNAAIFGEPTRNDRICIGYRGRVVATVEITSESGHASIPWEYDNSIEILGQIHTRLNAYMQEYNQQLNRIQSTQSDEESHFEEISITPTVISAGSESNNIPSTGRMVLDIRLPPSISVEKIQTLITTEIQTLKSSFKRSTTHIHVEFASNFAACIIPQTNLVLSALRWAIFQETKRKVGLIKKTGSSFTNLIQQHYSRTNPDFVCLTYGPGDSRLEHTDNECVEASELLETISIFHRFFPKFRQMWEKNNE